MSKRPRINDLSRLLNLSCSTVGAALSGRGGNTRVSEATRLRVLEAARRLNYRVNASASAVRTQRFNNIGFFSAKKRPLDYSFADAMCHGVSTAAKKHGQNVVLVRISELMEADLDLPRALTEACLDALVVQNASSVSAMFQSVVESMGVPVSYINEKRPANAAYVDDVSGGRIMAGHLVEQGFKKIMMLAPVSNRMHYSYTDRAEGFTEVLAAAGIQPLIKTPGPNWREDVDSWLDTANMPDVIFCANDQIALYLQRILYRLKLRIPDDIAIAGCNDEIFAEHSPVPLTSLRIDFNGLAQAAVDLVVRMFEKGETSIPSVVLQPELVVRDSTQRVT